MCVNENRSGEMAGWLHLELPIAAGWAVAGGAWLFRLLAVITEQVSISSCLK